MLKMHLMHLTYQTSQPSLACPGHLHLPTVGRHQGTQSVFDNNVLTISCNLSSTVLKVKNRIVVWGQNGCKYMVCLSCEICGCLGAGAPAQHHNSIRPLIYSLGEDPNSNLKYSFY